MNAILRPVDEAFDGAQLAEAPISYPSLPSNIEIEQALLGLLIVDNAKASQIVPHCAPKDFFDPLHQRMASVIFTMDAERAPISPLTLKARLDPDAGLSEIGGLRYLTSLALGAPEAANAVQLARIVADLALRRGAMVAIWDAQERLSHPGGSIAEIMRPVVEVADSAAERNAENDGPSNVHETAGLVIEALCNGSSDIIGDPVSTGIESLDEVLGGLYPANLVVVGGRTGMGKSTFGTVVARAAADQGVHVDYFSLEMTRAELVARIITDMDYDRFDAVIERPLSYSRLLKRRCSPSEIERARKIHALLSALDIEIHDKSMTIAEISALARAKTRRVSGKRLVVIDHLHRIKASDRYKGNRTIEIGESASQCKDLAKYLNCPVLLLSQLSREQDRTPDKVKHPSIDNLRQSGEIEEHADAVLLIHRPAYYIKRPLLGPADPAWTEYLSNLAPVKHDLEIDIAKNRHGETKPVKCFVEIGAAAIRGSDRRNQTFVPQEEFV